METATKNAVEMINDLIESHEAAIRKMRNAADFAESQDDFVTHDMLVGRLTFHEKIVWMLRSQIAE